MTKSTIKFAPAHPLQNHSPRSSQRIIKQISLCLSLVSVHLCACSVAIALWRVGGWRGGDFAAFCKILIEQKNAENRKMNFLVFSALFCSVISVVKIFLGVSVIKMAADRLKEILYSTKTECCSLARCAFRNSLLWLAFVI